MNQVLQSSEVTGDLECVDVQFPSPFSLEYWPPIYAGDSIKIFGNVGLYVIDGHEVTMRIVNPDGNIAYVGQQSTDDAGLFKFYIVPGGFNWYTEGTYAVKVFYNGKYDNAIEFEYKRNMHDPPKYIPSCPTNYELVSTKCIKDTGNMNDKCTENADGMMLECNVNQILQSSEATGGLECVDVELLSPFSLEYSTPTRKGDPLLISGNVSALITDGHAVVLQIVNQKSELVYVEQTNPENDGMFTFLAVSGGSTWFSGTHYVQVFYNGRYDNTLTFEYVGMCGAAPRTDGDTYSDQTCMENQDVAGKCIEKTTNMENRHAEDDARDHRLDKNGVSNGGGNIYGSSSAAVNIVPVFLIYDTCDDNDNAVMVAMSYGRARQQSAGASLGGVRGIDITNLVSQDQIIVSAPTSMTFYAYKFENVSDTPKSASAGIPGSQFVVDAKYDKTCSGTAILYDLPRVSFNIDVSLDEILRVTPTTFETPDTGQDLVLDTESEISDEMIRDSSDTRKIPQEAEFETTPYNVVQQDEELTDSVETVRESEMDPEPLLDAKYEEKNVLDVLIEWFTSFFGENQG